MSNTSSDWRCRQCGHEAISKCVWERSIFDADSSNETTLLNLTTRLEWEEIGPSEHVARLNIRVGCDEGKRSQWLKSILAVLAADETLLRQFGCSHEYQLVPSAATDSPTSTRCELGHANHALSQ